MVTNDDRKISKGSNIEHLETCKIIIIIDMTTQLNESFKRSRVGSKILTLENLELELNKIKVYFIISRQRKLNVNKTQV